MRKLFIILGVVIIGAIIMTGCSEKQSTTPNQSDQFQLKRQPTPPIEPTCGSIGDFVWYDVNQNGIQDASEEGVPGVEVSLYACGGTTPVLTVYTNENGFYLFQNLCGTGNAAVHFALPAGYVFSPKDQGSDDAMDSDANPDGWTDCFFFDGAGNEINLTIDAGIYLPSSGGCTYTMGYWKTHPDDWPVMTLDLGNNSYSQAQLLSIFNRPVKGNGLVSLAHQLIAAKLNVENGADPTAVQGYIDAADDMIDNLLVPPIGMGYLLPSTTSYLTEMLDNYNMGIIGPGHCDDMSSDQ